MSQSVSKTDPDTGSPEAQFRMPSTGRSNSPSNIEFNNHNDVLLRSSHIPQNTDGSIQLAESFSQGGGHAVYNSPNNFHLSDYLADSESLTLKPAQQGTKSPGDFGAGPFRSSFSAYNGANGTHTPHSTSGNPPPSAFRMRQANGPSTTSQSFASASESFASHSLGIPHQLSQQSQPGSSMSSSFETRGMDFGGSPPLAGKLSQQFALDPFIQSHAAKAQIHDSFHPLSHSNSTGQVPYLNGVHLQSQTPYGPHLQSSVAVGASNVARGLGGTGQLNASAEPQSGGSQQEEISTIFVVGFPDDMQEREFQNMFTFSSGFEAATLKIPNKEYTAYGSSGPNDPYNIVTVNQGGVVVDNGRDGPTTSWPPLPLNDEHSHFQGAAGLAGQPPRKQIIGFAKFRTRQEALDARDMLQGRRVDIEKGAVLKAEMAKKNLHTKRGVGIGSTSSSGGSVSLGNNMNVLAGLNGGVGGLGGLGGLGVTPDTLAGLAAGLNLNSSVNMNALASLGGSDSLAARGAELNALGAMGYNNLSGGWREGRLGDSSEDERERDRDRDREKRREAFVGLGMTIGRGARERALADEEERLRRKDLKVAQGETVRTLSGNSAVYDAFHPASTLPRNLPGGLLSPGGGPSGEGAASGPLAMLGNSFGGSVIAQTSNRDESGSREAVGPWDQPSPRERDSVGYAALSSFYGARKASVIPRPSSPRDNSPPKSNMPFCAPLHDEDGMLPPHRSGALRSTQPFASPADEPVHVQVTRPPAPPSSSTSSAGGLDDVGPVPLTVTTSGQGSTGNTSPQLPSPASHAGSSSSGGGHITSSSSGGPNNVGGVGPRNPLIDQNPPINTLYVGNLPTSPVGGGYPANYLEDSLRELFSRRPGYRKLCFRQKSNGPMCFVEFEDVHYATKALNELYGNTLGGLVKNGGIRLSYSKNPLGVRTPTTGSSSQQQTTAHSAIASPFPADTFQFRQGFDGDSGILNNRRESSAATSPPPPSTFGGYARSPPPPRFVSPPPPAGTFNMTSSTSPTNGTTLTRGSHSFGITLGGTGGGTNFSPFGLPLSSPASQSSVVPSSHSMIPDHPSSDVPLVHGHPQHFPHRALSPSSSTVEAARAG